MLNIIKTHGFYDFTDKECMDSLKYNSYTQNLYKISIRRQPYLYHSLRRVYIFIWKYVTEDINI